MVCGIIRYVGPIVEDGRLSGILSFWAFPSGKLGDFLENNNKTQTISLVRKRFKLFWFLVIQVKRGWFLGFLFYHLPTALSWWSGHVGRNRVQRCRFLSLESEFNELGFQALKPSPLDSVSRLENRVQWTCFPGLETDSFELGFFVCRNHSFLTEESEGAGKNWQKQENSNCMYENLRAVVLA